MTVSWIVCKGELCRCARTSLHARQLCTSAPPLRARSAPPRSASPLICLMSFPFRRIVMSPSSSLPASGRHDLTFGVTSLPFTAVDSVRLHLWVSCPHLLTLCSPRAPFPFHLLSLCSPFIHEHVLCSSIAPSARTFTFCFDTLGSRFS